MIHLYFPGFVFIKTELNWSPGQVIHHFTESGAARGAGRGVEGEGAGETFSDDGAGWSRGQRGVRHWWRGYLSPACWDSHPGPGGGPAGWTIQNIQTNLALLLSLLLRFRQSVRKLRIKEKLNDSWIFMKVSPGSPRCGDLPVLRHPHYDHHHPQLHRPGRRGSGGGEESSEQNSDLLWLHFYHDLCCGDDIKGWWRLESSPDINPAEIYLFLIRL